MMKATPQVITVRRGTLLAILAFYGLRMIDQSTRMITSLGLSPSNTRSETSVDAVTQRHSSDFSIGLNTTYHQNESGVAFSSTNRDESSLQIQQELPRQELQYTPAQQCRLELEKWLNAQIDELLQMGREMPPLIDWVWDMGDQFVINMRFHPFLKWNHNAFYRATWNWQDQFGNNFTIDGIWGKHEQWYPVLLPYLKVPPLNVTNQSERSYPVYLWASNITVPKRKSVRHFVYDLRPFLKCDRIETDIERPPPGTKIGMCVRFRGAHHLIPPFIAYHRLIGVEHFWFYANEEFDVSDLPAAPYLTYVPYRFVWTEHVMYSRRKGRDGIERPWDLEYNGDNFWQVEAMQQCLYRLKRYGLDWLMTNDVDEYLWLTKKGPTGVQSTSSNTSILQEFLLPYEDKPEIGGLAVEGWAFGANESQIGEMLDLQIDYVHRADQVTGGRRKIIYRVPTATRISVHWLYGGGSLIELRMRDIRWNHYRQPHDGVFQTQKQPFPLVRDSSLPDAYRLSIVEELKGYVYPNGSHVLATTSMTNSRQERV